MKLLHFLSTLITFALFINNAHCIRNLFLPRTGDITGISSATVSENLSNVTNFDGLLGAGRNLAYPFAAGMLLAISTIASENNWKLSDAGFAKLLGIPRDEVVDSYGTLLELLETDENVTLSNILFSFGSNFSPSEGLAETLMTEVQEATWTRETWKQTYQLMVDHLGNVTNEKIDTLLIPSVSKVGTPFRKATEAVILSTFHYINGWQYPWTDAEIGKFLENDGIPYLKVEGSFLVAEDSEYTAVSVPLEGGSKSVVFVLPHVNITGKYFRNQADGEDGSDQDEPTDIVPFPKNWKLKQLRLKVPTFNTTDVDQYGQELEQTGMNETFCTILRDYVGRYPYYLRPMVQVNFLDFNSDFLELASATGVAVEKFLTLFSVVGGGSGGDEDDKRQKQQSNDNKNHSSEANTSSNPKVNLTMKVAPDGGNSESSSVPVPEDMEKNNVSKADAEILTLSFDRPFLWYLNDSEVGPIFFGTVENLLNLALVGNSSEPGENDDNTGTTMTPVSGGEMNNNDRNKTNGNENADNTDANNMLSEVEKYFLWSCRSFTPSSPGVAHQKLQFSFESPFEENSASATGADNSHSSSPAKVAENESTINTSS